MNLSRKLFFSGFLLLVALASHSPLQAAGDKDVAGVVLSFDDTYVKQWYDYFGQRTDNDEVKATFFVSYWHTLSDAEIDKLRLLRAKGHEIGNHTYSHKGVAGDYNFDPSRVQEYLGDQIIPSLLNMRADGFSPVSFSYPSGERNEVYDAAVRQYFPYLRTTFTDVSREMFQTGEIFHGPNDQYEVLAGDGIDNSYNNPVAEIEAALLRAKTNNEIVTVYAHRILADGSPDADHPYGIRGSKLDRLIVAAKEMGLKFYTFEEAWKIGNQNGPVSNTNITVSSSGGSGSVNAYIIFLLSLVSLLKLAPGIAKRLFRH
ncbi:MAG: Unknown protein [uncultured Thiotrichaceae bacterium]|uniref:NodB homology domain-containing protein n=1 Tax=uncultured Thiotrichaceae bacterium TaxID=298394 RepID=A0A6S6SE14_9GAMM|nr:MAG: Unknown protein [uncultured Thiotrichaceae bacterium]